MPQTAILTFCQTITLICIITRTNGEINSRLYQNIPGNFDAYATSGTPFASMRQCAALCTEMSSCTGFLFNVRLLTCQMVSTSLSSTGSSGSSDWRYYVRDPRVCPSGWVEFNYVCYYFHNAGGSWNWAKDQCHSRNAKFVQITTKDEDDFIRNHIISIGYTNNGNRDFWIGSTDVAVEGEWRWVESGVLYTYTKWGPNQPDNNNGNQHCGILYQPTGYLWHDTECTNTNSFICEN